MPWRLCPHNVFFQAFYSCSQCRAGICSPWFASSDGAPLRDSKIKRTWLWSSHMWQLPNGTYSSLHIFPVKHLSSICCSSGSLNIMCTYQSNSHISILQDVIVITPAVVVEWQTTEHVYSYFNRLHFV